MSTTNRRRAILAFSPFWMGLIALPFAASAAELKKATLDAFERYTAEAESRVAARSRTDRGFLWVDESPERLRKVQQGEVAVGPNGPGEFKVPDGLIHDWIGAIFIPGATLDRTLALVHDYNNHKYIYKPNVLESKLLSQNGNEYRTSVRLLSSKVLTVVLDADYDVRYVPVDGQRCYSQSRSTRVVEVEHPGTAEERELPDGAGHGFLWRLYTYSRFQERDGGVYAECEAVSLSRGYPFGLAWVIRPMIRDMPGENLTKTLTSMRTAVVATESGRLYGAPGSEKHLTGDVVSR